MSNCLSVHVSDLKMSDLNRDPGADVEEARGCDRLGRATFRVEFRSLGL